MPLLQLLCHFEIGDFVNDVGTPGHTLQVKFALINGRTKFPAIVAIYPEVCVYIWLVRERAFDSCGTNNRVQPYNLAFVGEVLVVGTNDLLAFALGVKGTYFYEGDLALEGCSGHTFPRMVQLETRV